MDDWETKLTRNDAVKAMQWLVRWAFYTKPQLEALARVAHDLETRKGK